MDQELVKFVVGILSVSLGALTVVLQSIWVWRNPRQRLKLDLEIYKLIDAHHVAAAPLQAQINSQLDDLYGDRSCDITTRDHLRAIFWFVVSGCVIASAYLLYHSGHYILGSLILFFSPSIAARGALVLIAKKRNRAKQNYAQAAGRVTAIKKLMDENANQ